MEVIYWFFVKLYGLAILLASPFHEKAKDWVIGRRNYFQTLRYKLPPGEKRIWFHCSSLGEFEQGKPVLERLRKEYPANKIVLTFFSPSGFNIKKNDPAADYIFYLPLDGPINSRQFINLVNPVLVVFVKYEFWHFYIKILHEKKIPVFVISAIFRPSQIFFKSYGKFFYRMLCRITHIFVQDQASLELLTKNDLMNASVSGDTRFDRVIQTRSKNTSLKHVEQFKNHHRVLIAGSTWPADEQLLIQLINANKSSWKYIIAPHEINTNAIDKLVQQIKVPTVLYSSLKNITEETALIEKQVLIIDNIGLLSSMYAVGNAAYIGGGFGAGIHNILEAAVFGLPVFFGPNYQKFSEAKDLVSYQTAFVITDFTSLRNSFSAVAENKELLDNIFKTNTQYVNSKCGASDVIMHYLKKN